MSSSCQKWSEVCRTADSCCPVMGLRIVCAQHLEICGKKTCCITEVEEQQERQAAINRNRNPKLTGFWDMLNGEEKKNDKDKSTFYI
jgi:hypothetical protein